MTTPESPLPSEIPPPEDDGGADHLPGERLPDLELPSTDGPGVCLCDLGQPRTVLYVYPMTGQPGVPPPDGWDLVPGARGCTPEACAFRDHFGELRATGADVCGLSSQTTRWTGRAAAHAKLSARSTSSSPPL